ncbi:MAG: VOC family protein [Proteobacteria bacterium]|nr:VOC family protein [Pseudomonadota bacterium]
MAELALHHVSVIVHEVDRAAAFYENVLGFRRIARPPFTIPGIWYGLGALQVHITQHPPGNFRSKPVDNDDVHFALRTGNFDESLADLEAKGYSADLPPENNKRLIVKKTGLAGFPQIFLTDPDWNIIEINQAPV